MMEIHYRQARREDLPACLDVFLESVSDLRGRQNQPQLSVTPPERRLAFYEHALGTGSFEVAESFERPGEAGRIQAFACAILRDHLWFLAGFWVRPGWQRQHVGMPVLRRVWEAGRQAGTTHFFVWSSSDLPAMAAYMKIGMLPGCQILEFEGTAEMPEAPPAGYSVRELDRSFAMELDQVVLGTRREVDHEYLVRAGWQARGVLLQGQGIGYYYIKEGRIGPAAWNDPRRAQALLTLACREASADGWNAGLMVPGMNHAALRFAFDAGLRLSGFSHLFMSAPFGRLEQYCPSGPAIF